MTRDTRNYMHNSFFLIKPTRCTNFTNLFWHETLHVSDSSSVQHHEFIHCALSSGICHTAFEQDQDGTAVPSWSCSKATLLVRLINYVTWVYCSVSCCMLFIAFIFFLSASTQLVSFLNCMTRNCTACSNVPQGCDKICQQSTCIWNTRTHNRTYNEIQELVTKWEGEPRGNV